MGRIDAAAKTFLQDENVARSLVNLAIPGLLKEDTPLREMNPEQILLLFGEEAGSRKRLDAVVRHRDNFFSAMLEENAVHTNGECDFVLIGAEHQAEVDRSMPVRVLLLNALTYTMQLHALALRNRRKAAKLRQERGEGDEQEHDTDERPISWKEILSGLRETDMLRPVLTIVVYWSEKPWNAPRSLQELIRMPENLKEYVDNNKLIVVAPSELQDQQLDRATSDLGPVLRFLTSAGSREDMMAAIQADPRLAKIGSDAANVIAAVTGLRLESADTKTGGQNLVQGMIEIREEIDRLQKTVNAAQAAEALMQAEKEQMQAQNEQLRNQMVQKNRATLATLQSVGFTVKIDPEAEDFDRQLEAWRNSR